MGAAVRAFFLGCALGLVVWAASWAFPRPTLVPVDAVQADIGRHSPQGDGVGSCGGTAVGTNGWESAHTSWQMVWEVAVAPQRARAVNTSDLLVTKLKSNKYMEKPVG